MPDTKQFSSFENRPLSGQTIVVTRMREHAAVLSGPLRAAGAQVIEAPTIELGSMENYEAVDGAIRSIGCGSLYDWLVLTSANGVDAMFERLKAIGGDSPSLAEVKIAVIGSATAQRLSDHGVRADLVPPEAVGESMADALIQQDIRGKRILLLRGDLARKQLVADLREAGVICDDFPIYRNVCPQSVPQSFLTRYDNREIDWITLTSPSSFANLLLLLDSGRAEALGEIKLASIGPVTTQAIRDAGFTEAVEANPHNVQGLVAAICSA